MSVLDSFRLDGRVALVTGGNRGIGKAIATALVEAGAAVALAARNQERNEEVVAELEGKGATALGIQTDVTRRDDLVAARDEVTRALGPIDILVNNAGIGVHGDSLTIDDDEWATVLSTNLDAVWKASQVVGEQMIARRTGAIVNVGSMSGMIINRPQWHAPYGVSKAGVHHLTRSLAAEWAPHHVRVNAIAPGYTKTEISDIDDPKWQRYWIDEAPMRRYAQASEIAPAALYLASDAASFVTGTVLVVDGGYTLW